MTILPPSRTTADPSYPWWRRRADWLHRALEAGVMADADQDDEEVALELRRLGEIVLTDGRLVLADPYLMDEPEPIAQVLPAATYDVVVARGPFGGPRNAAAALVAKGAGEVVEWQHAHWGQDVAGLEGDHFVGYGVDAGTGCFASADAAVVAGRVLAADAGRLADPVSAALFATGDAAGAAVVAPEAGAAAIAVFHSGWGDGSYPTWLGVDEHGTVAVAITDFLVAGDPYTPEPAEPVELVRTTTSRGGQGLVARSLRGCRDGWSRVGGLARRAVRRSRDS